MWYGIVGLVLGLIIGYFAPLSIPVQFARYTAVGILGILDSILGAAKADLQGKYDSTIFISGLIFNMALAMGITYLGDKLSLDLYLAVLIVFTARIFNNIATIRYSILTKHLGSKRVEKEIQKGE